MRLFFHNVAANQQEQLDIEETKQKPRDSDALNSNEEDFGDELYDNDDLDEKCNQAQASGNSQRFGGEYFMENQQRNSIENQTRSQFGSVGDGL